MYSKIPFELFGRDFFEIESSRNSQKPEVPRLSASCEADADKIVCKARGRIIFSKRAYLWVNDLRKNNSNKEIPGSSAKNIFADKSVCKARCFSEFLLVGYPPLSMEYIRQILWLVFHMSRYREEDTDTNHERKQR